MFTCGPSLLAPAVSAPTLFVYDDFTAPNGTLISGRVGPVGCNPWSVTGAGVPLIENNQVRNDPNEYFISRMLPTGSVTGNFYIEVNFKVLNTGSTTDYILFYENSTGEFLSSISTNSGGSIDVPFYTALSPAFTAGNTYTVRYEYVGLNVTVKLDGTVLGTYPMAFLPSGIIMFEIQNIMANDPTRGIEGVNSVEMGPL